MASRLRPLVALSVVSMLAACESEPEKQRGLVSAPAALCGGAANLEDEGGDGDGDGDANVGDGHGDGDGDESGVVVGVGVGPGQSAASGGEYPPDETIGAGAGSGEGGSLGHGGDPSVGGHGGEGGANEGGAGGCGEGGASCDAGAGGRGERAGRARQAVLESSCEGVDLTKPSKLYLSSDDSNSMASPAIVRSLIAAGAVSVAPDLVRTHEFLNYYRYDFAPAAPGKLRIISQLASCDLTGDLALQIAVQSAPAIVRAPMSVTLILDTSGSMSGSPLELERAAVLAIASSLASGDVVNVVTWSTYQTPLLAGHVVSGRDDPTLVQVAESLEADGGTDLDAGLRAGYELAEQHREAGRLSRVVLVSDGQANAGITNEQLIGAAAEDRDGEGIYLVGVGVGEGFNDTLMDAVTDAGKGAYVYLDTPEEAHRIFAERHEETMLVAARDVRIEFTLPPYFGIAKFYGEEYSPDPAKVRTQHLAPNDSMMLYQILHPCDPSLPKDGDPLGVRVTWKDAITGADREETLSTTLGALAIDDGNVAKAAAVVAYAEAMKSLRDLEPSARIVKLEEARRVVRDLPGGLEDPDVVDILRTIQQAIANQSREGVVP